MSWTPDPRVDPAAFPPQRKCSFVFLSAVGGGETLNPLFPLASGKRGVLDGTTDSMMDTRTDSTSDTIREPPTLPSGQGLGQD